jgi:peptidoglycan/LPS O-acetylase OafA/YrhL
LTSAIYPHTLKQRSTSCFLPMKKSLTPSKELDGLRGCASLSVLVLHLVITVTIPLRAVGLSNGWRLADQLAGLGSLGVDVFFVLSGFLITSLLLADRGEPAYYRNFYWKRILRIQPVYLLHLIAVWFLLPGSHGYVVLALLFIVNFDDYFRVVDVGPAWTLAIEEQFYLVWPQVIGRLSIRNIYRVSIGVLLFSSCLRSGMLLFLKHAALRNTWYRLDGLAMGALLACQWMGEGEGTTDAIRVFLRVFNSRLLLVAAVAYEVSFILGFSKSIALIILPTNYLVYRSIGYIMHHPGSKPFGWLASKPLVFCGAISYSMYMFHTILIYLYDTRITPQSLDPGKFFLRAGVVCTATLITCIVVRYAIELPAQHLRKYVLR